MSETELVQYDENELETLARQVTTRQRVHWIATAMASGEWTGVDHGLMQHAWRIGDGQLGRLISEAKRWYSQTTGDADQLREFITLRLATIASEDAPDRTRALQLLRDETDRMREQGLPTPEYDLRIARAIATGSERMLELMRNVWEASSLETREKLKEIMG